MEWDWLGTEDAPQGIATYCIAKSKIALALPCFEKGDELARFIDDVRAEAWDAARAKVRAEIETMFDGT